MGYLARRRAKREAERRAREASYVNERSNVGLLDPAATALLYTTVASDHASDDERHDDLSGNYDDTALDDTSTEPVDSSESSNDTGSDFGQDYSAPTYDFSGPSYDSGSSSSYDFGSSSSYDSGSSYSDSGSSY